MAVSSSIFISRSVGKGGANLAADVRTVQARLNELMPPGRTRLVVDGKCGPLTKGSIAEFQTIVCGMRFPDGRADPGGKTVAALSDGDSAQRWNAAGPHSPAELPPNAGAPAGGAPATAAGAKKMVDSIKALPGARPVRGVNTAPGADGDLTLYETHEFKDRDFYARTRKAVFVNGMDNNPEQHRKAATLLSTLLRCPVYGLFNATDGVGADFVQCVNDKSSFLGRSVASGANFALLIAAVDALHEEAKALGYGTSRHEVVEWLLDGNRATLELFRQLRTGVAKDKKIPIYAHSQGNLITSNALAALALADGLHAIMGREVHSYGSPVRWWPPGLKRTDHLFNLDAVGLLRFRRDLDTNMVYNTLGDFSVEWKFHAFELYVMHDPDFLINSACWTQVGLLRVIDTEALATLLVKEGNNPARIAAVFERLIEVHWGEDDDVALSFCGKMKQLAPSVMRAMVRDPMAGTRLVTALETCLVGRTLIATAEEESALRWVKSLQA
jgi:hypothetical protein